MSVLCLYRECVGRVELDTPQVARCVEGHRYSTAVLAEFTESEWRALFFLREIRRADGRRIKIIDDNNRTIDAVVLLQGASE